MDPQFRSFDPERDSADVARIWTETRWIDGSDGQRDGLAEFLAGGAAEVATVNGSAECLTHRTPGLMYHGATALPLSAITAVTTSHLGRRQRLASTLVSRALRLGAEEGAALSALGMFEQGFYDRFGFGTGSAEVLARFDPGSLDVQDVPSRTPERLSVDHSAEMAECLGRRMTHHGLVVLDAPRVVAAEWKWSEDPFALGFRTDGRLSHFVMGSWKTENGPFDLQFMSFETGAQCLELLRLLYDLSDQLHSVKMIEPPEVQLHQLLREPVRQRSRSLKAEHETIAQSATWWQFRILDVDQVVGAIRWPGEPVAFTVELSDPVGRFLDPHHGWSGVGGSYRIELGPASSAERVDGVDGVDLRCSVNSLTRLLFGVRPASSLALTDEFVAAPDLLERLDDALTLRAPQPSLLF